MTILETALAAEKYPICKPEPAAHVGERLFAYMIERENIRKRKEAGFPAPWTADPILQEGRFTNVRRSDDRTTRQLMANFYKPNVGGARPGDVLFHCVMARFFGNADGVTALGWQVEWDVDAMIEKARKLDEQKRLFTGAYVITNNGERGPKYEFVCRKVLTPIWSARHRIAETAMQPSYGWEYLCGQLRAQNGLGGVGFMAKEVAQDFILAMDWRPRDLNTFTPIGPGARRGLNRLHGRPVDEDIKATTRGAEYRFLKQTRDLFAVRHQFLPPDFVDLQLHDIQFCLCELDKYLRVKLDDGKLKRRYKS